LEGGPQLGVRIDAFELLEWKHDLRDARHRPFAAGHLFDAMQGDEADRVVSAVDEEAALAAHEDLSVHQRLERQVFRYHGVTCAHGLRRAMACQQPLKRHLLGLDRSRAIQKPADKRNPKPSKIAAEDLPE